jgi:hypothetical protein
MKYYLFEKLHFILQMMLKPCPMFMHSIPCQRMLALSVSVVVYYDLCALTFKQVIKRIFWSRFTHSFPACSFNKSIGWHYQSQV